MKSFKMYSGDPDDPQGNEKAIKGLFALIPIGLAIWYFWGGGLQQQATRDMDDIEQQVAADSVKQYNIAKSGGGTKIDVCVQAGFVTAAYLQAQDVANYERWKVIEKSDCAAAGVPKE